MDVVCIGDCGIDRYRPNGEEHVGGITANFAVYARQAFPADDSIHIIAPLGDDAQAKTVRQHFAASGIDCRFMARSGRTPVQEIEVDDAGERRFLVYHEGVLAGFRLEQTDLPDTTGLVVTPVFAQNRDMFESVMQAATGIRTAVDFADFAEHPDLDLLRAHADAIDVGFFGLSPDHRPLFDGIREISEYSSMLAIVTLGADGSVLLKRGGDLRCAAAPVPTVIDTTGAGDAFAAGFLGGYCKDGDIEAALLAGSGLAAAAVQIVGGHDRSGF